MTSAFDAIAATYDTVWTTSPIGRAQRDQVWRVIDHVFQPGDLVLDIGCGTGEDARHLARRGIHVRGIDASSQMVAAARARGVAAEHLAIEELDTLDASFDGVLSDFGALNCVRDLRSTAVSLAGVIRPGGYAALCFLNRTCAWEMLYYASHGKFRNTVRRLNRNGAKTSLGVRVSYPSARAIRTAFANQF